MYWNGVDRLNPRKVAEQELLEAGFLYLRKGGSHDLYYDPLTHQMIPLSRSSHFSTDDLKMIRSEIRSVLRSRQKGE